MTEKPVSTLMSPKSNELFTYLRIVIGINGKIQFWRNIFPRNTNPTQLYIIVAEQLLISINPQLTLNAR